MFLFYKGGAERLGACLKLHSQEAEKPAPEQRSVLHKSLGVPTAWVSLQLAASTDRTGEESNTGGDVGQSTRGVSEELTPRLILIRVFSPQSKQGGEESGLSWKVNSICAAGPGLALPRRRVTEQSPQN